ncbi:MAG TPA: hypothetical protein VFE05_04600 [Longimicrobiaceae bacterium]|nr:hypothetical protein [Longimicrobiaceae bacterium]
MTQPDTHTGGRARFRIRDVHHPETRELLEALHGGDVLEGEVLDLSDSGLDPAVFAVIRVDRFDRPVVLPVERLVSAPAPEGGR